MAAFNSRTVLAIPVVPSDVMTLANMRTNGVRSIDKFDDFLRDIEEILTELRAQLEPLESGKLRTAEIRDGNQVDTTDARIVGLKRWIASYEAIAAKIRAGEVGYDDLGFRLSRERLGQHCAYVVHRPFL